MPTCENLFLVEIRSNGNEKEIWLSQMAELNS